MSEKIIAEFAAEVEGFKTKVREAAKAAGEVGTTADGSQKQFQGATNKMEKNLQGVAKEGKKSTDGLKKGFSDVSQNADKFGGVIGGAIKQLKLLTAAAKAFIATPLGLILAGIAVALAAVRAAFTSGEEGQNRWNKVVTVSGAILDKFNDLLADVGEQIIRLFTEPEQALKDFSKLIQDFVIRRFEEVVSGVKGLGTAIQLLFEGEFKEAAKAAGNALLDITTGLNPVLGAIRDNTDAIKEFGDELVDTAEKAAKVADQRARADKLERQLLVDRAKLESEIAALRLKSRQEDEFTAEQRKNALLEAQALEEELLAREKQVLELRRDAQIAENQFARSNKENLDAEAQAIAAVSQVEARRLTAQRSTQRELNRLNKELERQLEAELKLREDINKEIMQSQQRLLDGELSSYEQRLVAAQRYYDELLEREGVTEEQRLEIIQLSQLEEAQIRMEREQDLLQQLRGMKLSAVEQEIEDERLKFEELKALALEAFEDGQDRRNLILDLEQEFNDRVVGIHKEAQRQMVAATAARLAAEFQAFSQVSGAIKGLLGEQAEDARAMALFTIGLSTASGVANAVAQGAAAGPFPANLAAIATGIAAVLSGIAQAKSFLSGSSVPSFDGGGATPSGARRGGIDGKGGMWSIMHPNEVVVDLTKPSKGLAELVNHYGFADRMNGKSGGSSIFDDSRIVEGLMATKDAVVNSWGNNNTGRNRYKKRAG
jgi:hypothetical protein